MMTNDYHRSIATGIITLIAACSILVSACQRPQKEGGNEMNGMPLESTYWKLVRLGDGGAVPGGEPEAHIIFNDSSATGRTGCNHMSGSYERNGDALKFGPLITTKMACPDRMDLEQRFLAALGATERWKITGNGLELYNDGGKMVAAFEPGEKR